MRIDKRRNRLKLPMGYCGCFLSTIDQFCFIYFLSHTRFRWKQDASNNQGTMWALNHVYVGEKCPDMCNGRGLCNNGVCDCQSGYGMHELNVT